MGFIAGYANEGSPVDLVAQVRKNKTDLALIADISSIAAEVWRTSPPPRFRGPNWRNEWAEISGSKIGSTIALTPSDVMSDTATDWDLDALGSNFLWSAPASAIGSIPAVNDGKGEWRRVEIKFTPAVGQPKSIFFWFGLYFSYSAVKS